MFGLSFGELLIIFAVALLVLGPQGLPGLARTLGKALRQFRSATSDLRSTMESEFYKLDEEPKAASRIPPRPFPDQAVSRDPAAPGAPAGTPDGAASAPEAAAATPEASAPEPAAGTTSGPAAPGPAAATPAGESPVVALPADGSPVTAAVAAGPAPAPPASTASPADASAPPAAADPARPPRAGGDDR